MNFSLTYIEFSEYDIYAKTLPNVALTMLF